MTKRLILSIVASLVVLAAPIAAAPPPGSINIAGCAAQGGARVVPSGIPVVIRVGWLVKTRGLIEAFLHAQSTNATVGGVALEHPDTYWSDPEPSQLDGQEAWVTWWIYPTGIALASGETLHVSATLTLPHPLPDLLVFDDHRPVLFSGTFGPFDCALKGA